MSAAGHRVARQTVELVAPDRALADRLADRVAAAAPRIAALLGDRLDAADDGRRHRLDRLVVALPGCDPGRFEESLLAALDRALAEALPRSLAAADPVDPVEDALDLLAALAGSGRLPWWAPGERAATAAAETLAAAHGSGAGIRYLLALPAAPERFARAIPGPSLARLAARLTGIAPDALAAAALRLAAASPERDPVPASRDAWTLLLRRAAGEGRDGASEPSPPPQATMATDDRVGGVPRAARMPPDPRASGVPTRSLHEEQPASPRSRYSADDDDGPLDRANEADAREPPFGNDPRTDATASRGARGGSSTDRASGIGNELGATGEPRLQEPMISARQTALSVRDLSPGSAAAFAFRPQGRAVGRDGAPSASEPVSPATDASGVRPTDTGDAAPETMTASRVHRAAGAPAAAASRGMAMSGIEQTRNGMDASDAEGIAARTAHADVHTGTITHPETSTDGTPQSRTAAVVRELSGSDGPDRSHPAGPGASTMVAGRAAAPPTRPADGASVGPGGVASAEGARIEPRFGAQVIRDGGTPRSAPEPERDPPPHSLGGTVPLRVPDADDGAAPSRADGGHAGVGKRFAESDRVPGPVPRDRSGEPSPPPRPDDRRDGSGRQTTAAELGRHHGFAAPDPPGEAAPQRPSIADRPSAFPSPGSPVADGRSPPDPPSAIDASAGRGTTPMIGEGATVPPSFPARTAPTRSPVGPAADRGASRKPAHDALYPDNAGMPLLWPLMPRLLAEAELLNRDGRFAAPAARHRAAMLLDHLVSGDRDPPEPRLALAKLFAGLAVDAPFDPGPPLTDRESEAAAATLGAALEALPMLGRLGIGGLRGAWLARPGRLAVEHGGWTLRVERRAWDVLLDRLPWPVTAVALPWMPDPVRVEW